MQKTTSDAVLNITLRKAEVAVWDKALPLVPRKILKTKKLLECNLATIATAT